MPRLMLLAVALAILAIGCGDSAPKPPAPTAGPAPTATAVPNASFEFTPCNFDLPDGQYAGAGLSCGFLIVPEDRTVASSPKIKLFVAVLRAQGATEAADPIIYLAGGPGGSASRIDITYYTAEFAKPLQEKRDIVFFDQRGVGLSLPSLDCPELRESFFAYTTDNPYDEAMQRCHDRIAATGVNLASYASTDSVADINDLATVLGYETYNLFGVSYGTRLALTAMRDAPQRIRSVVLDSSVPLQANFYSERGVALETTLDALFDACSASASCRAFAPDLRGSFFRVLAQLEASPAFILVSDPYTNETFEAAIDGDGFLELVLNGFFISQIIPRLPAGIVQVENGDYRMLETMASFAYGQEIGIARGFYYSVQCAEEVPFNTPDTVTNVNNPALRVLLESAVEGVASVGSTCARWNVPAKGPIENAPVVSDIPTLVLAGQYDAITPPLYGRLAASTLSHSTYFEFPGAGHAVLDTGCSMDIVVAFYDDPQPAPDGSCIAAIPPPDFSR